MSRTNGTGHGPAKFTKRLEYHQRMADAYQMVLADLRGDAVVSSKKRAGTTLDQAIAIDAERRDRTHGRKRTKSTMRQRREATAVFLGQFNASTPRRLTENIRRAVGLVRHGYLKAREDGYVRTGKVFTV